MLESKKIPAAYTLDAWTAYPWSNGLQVESLTDMAQLCVKTRNSLYEITVIDGSAREILVRGGQFFPQWTPARIAGSSLGRGFLKIGGIYAGFNLEIVTTDQTIITSQVQSIDLVSPNV